MDRHDVELAFNVSRETSARLATYETLLNTWQVHMNLVGPSTLPAIWQRHFADSLQLQALAPAGQHWLDIGAGAGFPGLVIALADPQARVTLVESIRKKCGFLNAAAVALQVSDQVTVENRRVETLPAQGFDIITARALAPLAQIMAWGLRHATPSTRWILPKGARVAEEIAHAERDFRFQYELIESRTDPSGRIVIATDVMRR